MESSPKRSATRARNPRGEGHRLRQEILLAAADLLDESGTEHAVTLRAVARRVGIAAPSIYAHFPDRQSILLAVAQAAFAELEEQLRGAFEQAGATDPRRRLGLVCSAYLDFAAARPQRYRVMFGGGWNAAGALGAATAAGEADISEALMNLGMDALGVLVAAVQDCVDAGSSASTDAFADATRLWVGLHGLAELKPAAPLFPWPPDVLDVLVERLALLAPRKA